MNEVILMGISLNNSYYSNEENIRFHLNYFLKNFPGRKIYILVIDEPTIYNYLAAGYSFEKSRNKLRKKSLNMNNKILRAIQDVSYCENIIQNAKHHENIIYLNWTENIENNEIFLQQKEKIFNTNDLKLWDDIFSFSKYASIDSIYLIEELAFLSSFREIFSVDKVLISYHKKWEIFDNFISGVYSEINNGDKFDFLLVEK